MNISDATAEKCHKSSSCSSGENLSAPLSIKLGFMKNFVKGVDKTSHGFKYERSKFLSVSDAKIKEGICIGSQIRELMQDKQFDEDQNETI